MRPSRALTFAATVTALAALLTPHVTAKSPATATSGKTSQSLRGDGTARLTTPTWKTFSSTGGRGTRITISTAGNVTSYASPNIPGAVYEHIGVGAVGEGYVLCYNGVPGGSAYDLGEATSGFNTPQASATDILRTTTDNKVSLRQTFTFTPGAPEAPGILLIQMDVKNTSATTLNNVLVRRQVDFDIDTGGASGWAGFLSNHARTKAAVMAFHDPIEAPAGSESHGIMLQMVRASGGWTTQVTQSILDPACNPSLATISSTFFVARGDYGDSISFALGSLAPGQTKTVQVRYQRY